MNSSDFESISFIFNTCKQIGCPQRILQYVAFLYYKSKNIYKDDINFILSIIILGCKIDNFFIDLEYIIKKIPNDKYISKEKIDEFELKLCIEIDFDFNIQDVYKLIKKLKIEKKLIKTIWILLNDSLYLPLRIKYREDDIIVSCLYISKIANNSKTLDFDKIKKEWNCNYKTIEDISNLILRLYET